MRDGQLVRYGIEYWFKNSNLHREDGPAVIHKSGTRKWYKNGNLHREDGPAIDSSNGDLFWYQNGLLHREDGPALIYEDGYSEWYYKGKDIDSYKKLQKYTNHSDRYIIYLKLKYGEICNE